MADMCSGWTDDALAFFERLKAGLRPDGVIIIKENVCASGFVVDKVCTLLFTLYAAGAWLHSPSSLSSEVCAHKRDVMSHCGANHGCKLTA